MEYTRKPPNYGELMTVEDFLERVKSRNLTDWDGHGLPVKDGLAATGMQNWITPSTATVIIPKDATHIVWFNK